MKTEDLVRVDALIKDVVGQVVRVPPGRYDELPWWEGKGAGLAALVSYQGRPALAARLTDELAMLISVQIEIESSAS